MDPSQRLKEGFWIVDQVIEGLSYIHEELCTVHRDIKPHNIFMKDDFTVKIGDLGLIKPMNAQPSTLDVS